MKTPLGYFVFILTIWKHWSSVGGLVYNIEVIPNLPGRTSITFYDVRPKIAYEEQYYSFSTRPDENTFLKASYSGGQLYKYILRICEGDGEHVVTFDGNDDKELEIYGQAHFASNVCTYWRVKDLTYEDWYNAELITTDPPNRNSPPCRYGCIEISKETCAICLETLGDTTKVKALPCNHFFHKKCIEDLVYKFQGSACPVCRADVNTGAQVEPRRSTTERDAYFQDQYADSH